MFMVDYEITNFVSTSDGHVVVRGHGVSLNKSPKTALEMARRTATVEYNKSFPLNALNDIGEIVRYTMYRDGVLIKTFDSTEEYGEVGSRCANRS